jgi:hypothetical protein
MASGSFLVTEQGLSGGTDRTQIARPTADVEPQMTLVLVNVVSGLASLDGL